MPGVLSSALIVSGIALAGYVIARFALLPLVYRAAHRTSLRWDDILTDRKVLNRLSWLVPLLVARLGTQPVLGAEPATEGYTDVVERILGAGILVVALFVISAVATAIERIYSELDIARQRPIKGYLQVGVIIVWVLGAIVVIALLANQDVGVLVGGLGAFSAVVILVFRETIVSLVASTSGCGRRVEAGSGALCFFVKPCAAW